MQSNGTLSSFLSQCRIKNKKTQPFTHTRIGSEALHIFGGSYYIPKNSSDSSEKSVYDTFLPLYIKHVILGNQPEYLTEKQLLTNSPILLDFDFRYDSSITERQHDISTIYDILEIYINILCEEFVDIPHSTQFPIFIFEKNDVVQKENFTKDGIHIIIGISLDKPAQILLREKVLSIIHDQIDDIPIINEWSDVIDYSIVSGNTNWQLYGSRKPGCEPYKLTHHLIYEMISESQSWKIIKKNIEQFDYANDFPLLTAQYDKHISFPLKSNLIEKIDQMEHNASKSKQTQMDHVTTEFKNLALSKDTFTDEQIYSSFASIQSMEELDTILENIIFNSSSTIYIQKNAKFEYFDIQEVYECTINLPPSYYELGRSTYAKWIRVAWALKNTCTHFFPIWVKMSSQADGFSFSSIPDMLDKWNRSQPPPNSAVLTHRSIRFWCSQENPDAFKKIIDKSVDNYIIHTLLPRSINETDLANVLYRMYKDSFICSDIQHDVWFEYLNHRWSEMDSATTLRNAISKTLYSRFESINDMILGQIEEIKAGDENTDTTTINRLQEYTKKIYEILNICCLKTSWKKNIMYEAKFLFKDELFSKNLDTNLQLLCFKNGVVDFQNKEFRKGKPDDYVSLCTNTIYTPIDRNNPSDLATIQEIETFMEQLFPIQELRDYMWDHLASTLIGINRQQAINIYIGKGRNGKSKLIELMTLALGNYVGTVPVSLITQKRGKVGGTSSEIAQLRGVRYAVMQEPSKGDKINDGVLKQITGGDPVNARELYAKAITFTPQFKLAMCTNNLPEIESTDDGIWRRIKCVEFLSKFTEDPYNEKHPKEQYPYQFPVDTHIEEKFNQWVGIFTALLVERAFQTDGHIQYCEMVERFSNQYRDDQDVFSEFFKTNVKRASGMKIMKNELTELFKIWFIQHHGKNIPKGRELFQFMDGKCGKFYNGGWQNHSLIYD